MNIENQEAPRLFEEPDGLSAIVDRNIRMRAFLLRFLDPEDLGYTVNEALRDEVRNLLGMRRAADR